MTPVTDLTFYKMHGLGNDFIVLDSRDNKLCLMAADAISGRRHGVLAVSDHGMRSL